MTISELIERSNPEDMDESLRTEHVGHSKLGSVGKVSRNVLIIGILILSTTASFGLGYLAGHEENQAGGLVVGTIPITAPASGTLTASALHATSNSNSGTIPSGGEVVASSVTHEYFLPWCAGATKILNTQKVWFANEQEAVSHGYTAGKGCGGI